MTSFLSTISGQFAKNILIGTLFPVMLFVIAINAAVLPLADVTPHAVFALIFPWEQDSTVAALTVFVLVATVLLFSLNNPLIRLYEGYPWQDSWIGKWGVSRQRKQARSLRQVRDHANLLVRQAGETKVSKDLPAGFSQLLDRATRASDSFPVRESSILPTRLGNVIRAFEGYAKSRYGIDAIVLWPRLVQELPKEFTESLDGAKSSFDFMLNCSILSTVCAVAATIAGLVRNHPFDWSHAFPWLSWTVFFLALAYLFYQAAINRAASWGTQVKVAFDLYRFDLLSGLGYKLEVSGPKEERALWNEISRQLLYPNMPNLVSIPYKTGPTSFSVTPLSTVVTAARSMSWQSAQVFEVTIVLKNEDAYRYEAKSVVLTEKIAKGLRVVENSVLVDSGTAIVRSLDPLVIEVGPMNAGGTKTLRYQLRRTRRSAHG